MIGLSSDIKLALDTVIEGLEYRFNDDDLLNPEKMQIIMKSKVSSFKSAKDILMRWSGSPNAPKHEILVEYVKGVIHAGDKALLTLRHALRQKIDYKELDATSHNQAIAAKSFILESVFDLDKALIDLRNKLEDGNLDLSDKEFKLGYPEVFAKKASYDIKNYFKDWYNEDTDGVNICPHSTIGETIVLQDLSITLPEEPEDKTKILFHNLPQKEQHWVRQQAPEEINPDNVELWDEFIKEEYRRRREGVWFYNNGEAVYLTGHHYFALQWCAMLDNGGYMDFRVAQLKMFYHIQACITDKRCLGQLFVKSRRTGFTYAVLCVLLNQATTTPNSKFGMTSKSGDDVQEAFDKMSYMFLSLPFYFRPVVRGKEDSPNELFFGKPSNNSKEAKKTRNTGIKDYLNTSIDHRPTKNDSYDSVKLDGYLGDEAAKWMKPHDYIVHLGMVAPTMMPNGKVVGKAYIGSTMGARAKGGDQYVEMINGSQVSKRNNITKKTSTGLYMYFLPAQDNMEEYTDKYGKCHVLKPEVKTYNISGELIERGSIEYLLAVEEQKKSQSDKALNEQLRTYPRTLEHALRDEESQCVFNINKLYEQIDYDATLPEESLYTRGNFRWKSGVVDTDVEFYPDDKGRFKISWMPSKVDNTEGLKNAVKRLGEKYYPLNLECVRLGCDPFSLKSTHGKGSKGGIHGKTIINPDGGAPSNKFVLEYLARPTDETVFFEDVIMCCRFYGAPILVESNRIDLLRHMRNRGYRGFCMDRLDRPKSKLNPNELEYGGQVMSGKDILDSHMNAIGLWVENYVGVYNNEEQKVRPQGEMGDMPFEETLKDWLAFNPDKRTEYDATISSGLAIMACHTERYRGKKEIVKRIHVKSLLKKYNNKGAIGSQVTMKNSNYAK
jgi:hypothetical protein